MLNAGPARITGYTRMIRILGCNQVESETGDDGYETVCESICVLNGSSDSRAGIRGSQSKIKSTVRVRLHTTHYSHLSGPTLMS